MTPDPSFSLQEVQHSLRTNLPYIAVASIVLVGGLGSIILYRLRPRDRLLLWLGVFASAFGVRLFFQNDLIYRATGMDAQFFQAAKLFLTYFIPVPLALFARDLIGPGWKKSISAWLWIEIGFAVIAIPCSILFHQLAWTDTANSILIIAGTLLILLHIFLDKGLEASVAPLRWPLVLFGAVVVLKNARVLPQRIDLEPFGFLILLFGLSYTALRQAVARETALTEVEQELATARRIQISILPRTSPELVHLRIASHYEPMTAVAGDFYDFLKTGEYGLTILVADVSGHGVPAALVASMLKICFIAQRALANDPARVLAGFNTMLRDVLVGQYVTAACAAIDLSLGTVTYAGAGHPPSLLLRKNGELVQLAENGLFIGPFPQATYSNMSVPFETGDKLLLYTDGIVEATAPDGAQFGQERLIECLREGKDLDPGNFVEQLLRKIAGPIQEDDLTVVLAQVE